MNGTDHRDLAIRDLAASEHALHLRVAELEADVEARRFVSVEALHFIAALTAERDGLRRQLEHLRDEYREFREQVTSGNDRRAQAAGKDVAA